jgi:hypothetical protein
MTRKVKTKANEEVIEVAQSIATAVQGDQPSTPSKASKTQAKRPQPVSPPKVKEEVVEVVMTSPNRSVRIKATASVRGVFGNMRYAIEAGQVYTFPEGLANWLIEQGRAI